MLYSGYSKQLDNLNIAHSSYISFHAWPNMLCPKLSPKQGAECPFRNSDFHLHKDKIIQNIELLPSHLNKMFWQFKMFRVISIIFMNSWFTFRVIFINIYHLLGQQIWILCLKKAKITVKWLFMFYSLIFCGKKKMLSTLSLQSWRFASIHTKSWYILWFPGIVLEF